MLVQLYASHIFPNLIGWLPEPFGGIPFPVFYPPLFYWSGALFMKLTGLSAPLAVKLLTTLTFAVLPGVLFILGRRVGLRRLEALLAAGWAGVIACGSNVASLSGIGLLGEFEVGLYTQTLGFVWLCVWCAFLPYSQRCWKPAVVAVFALCATILSNVHVLPFAAIHGVCWLALTHFRRLRLASTRRHWPHFASSFLWLITPVVIAGIWLVPLIRWYRYSVGRPLPTEGLFASLGGFNVVWPACLLVAWKERKHLKLVVLCVAVILTAITALTPLGELIKWIPFQPARVLAGPMILATIPLTRLFASTLFSIVGGERWVVNLSLALLVVVLAWIHPSQRFGIASFSGEDGQTVEQIRRALQQLPPGKLLVELVESNAVFNSPARDPKELALSRAIAHEIAIDGRPILWSVFREQTLISPFSTAANNLFSTTREHFGIGGFAVEESLQDTLTVTERIKITRHLGVQYYLVKTPAQVELLSRSSEVFRIWNIGEWHLFADKQTSDSSVTRVTATPVLAWTSARFKNRSETEVDLFNLGEALAFLNHPEIPVLWAFTEGTDISQFLSSNAGVVLIVDPSVQPIDLEKLLSSLKDESSRRLHVIVLNDHSGLVSFLLARQEKFASLQTVDLSQSSGVYKDVIRDVADSVINLDRSQSGDTFVPRPLWQTTIGYFSAWHAQNNGQIFLTGQGSMAVWTPQFPTLRWTTTKVQMLSLAVCVFGALLLFVNLKLSASLRSS